VLSRYNAFMNQGQEISEHHETPERFPSQEEIKSTFETILEGKEYKELRLLSDGEGVRLYEIEVTMENGEKREYYYEKAAYDFRDKSLPTTAQFSAYIYMTEYNSDGMSYGGQCVANYLDGTWHYVPQS
jgi:hypothetical protein